MKKIALFLCAALLGVAARAADSVPLFNATLTIGKEHRFVLVGADGKTSQFLSLGEKFEGYTLKAYDAKAGLLDLDRDGKITQVSLVGAAGITNGAPTTATKATLADAEQLFKLMKFEEMMGKILDAQKKAMGPAMEANIAQSLARANINMSPEDLAKVTEARKQMVDETLSAINGPQMREAVAKIYSEVFTKEEMASMASFYATPAGQAMNEKQPEVQEKMMGVMMPLLMQNQQAAQQKMQATMREITAKYRPQAPGAPAATPGAAPAAPTTPTAPVAPKN